MRSMLSSAALISQPHKAVSGSDNEAIAMSGGAVLVASAFGNGLNYAFGIFLARMLGVDDFGLYALALTVFNMVSLTVLFGMDIGVVKFVSHHLEESQPTKARDTIVAALILTLGSGLAAAISLALLAGPIAVGLYKKPDLVLCLFIFSAAIPLATVTNVLISALQAHQMVRFTILIKYMWEPIGKFLLAGCLLWAGFNLVGVLLAVVLVFAISTAIAVAALYRLTARLSEGPSMLGLQEAKTLIAYCLPLTIANIFGVVAPRADILILGYWTKSEEVGVYLAAFQTAAILSLVLGAFVTGAAPILSRAWGQHGLARMQASYQTVSRLSIIVSLPIFCGLILFAKDILGIFGTEFIAGVPALIVLALGQIFNNATGAANSVLLMSGHSRLVMMNTVVMGIVLLAATAASIPLWGIIGAAFAASGTFIVINVIRVIQVWRLHRVQPYTWDLAKPLAAAAAASTIVSALRSLDVLDQVPALWILLSLLYLAGLLLLKINQQDRLMLQSLLSRMTLGLGRT